MSTAEVKDGAANGPKVEVVHSKPVGVPGQEEGGLEDSEPEDREDEEDVEEEDEGPGLGALIGDDIASDDEDVDFTADATVEDPEPELELGDDEEEAEPQATRDAPVEELGPRKRQKVAA